jgi:hypothetical protein
MRVTLDKAARMVLEGQAAMVKGGRALRLLPPSSDTLHPCRTHTSRGGMLAAIGRSQQYTVSERQRVTGFKSIYPEDRPAFHTAVLDCIAGFRS